MLAAWLGGAVVLTLLAPAPDPGAGDGSGFLPPDAPSQAAAEALGRHFPRSAGLSQAVVAFERPDDPATPAVERLTGADMAALDDIVRRIKDPRASDLGERLDLRSLQVIEPGTLPELREVLLSPPRAGLGQGALVIVQIPATFITIQAAGVVDHLQHIVDTTDVPAGLTVAVTGSAGFGHDYAAAAEASHERTLWVTVLAVIFILLLVYRAPLAAAVPLGAVAVAVVVAVSLLAAGESIGVHVGAGERIFIYVLLFGAGVDYSLFFLGRFREQLEAGRPVGQAVAGSWLSTAPAIAASAGTTIAGLSMLMLARYGVYRNVGPAAALALAIALAAALTLVPALAAVAGRGLFWPGKVHIPTRRAFWKRVAMFVTVRPALTLLVVGAVLAVPAVQATRVTWVYDTLADLKETYPAMRGAAVIRRQWSVGELAPISVLIETDPAVGPGALREASARLTEQLRAIPGVVNVRSASDPIGRGAGRPEPPPGTASRPPGTKPAPPEATTAPSSRQVLGMLESLKGIFTRPIESVAEVAAGAAAALRDAVVAHGIERSYLTDGAMRLEVVMADPPFSNAAMATLEAVGTVIRAEAESALPGARVHLAGATAGMVDVRSLTRGDFRRVAVAALVVIVAIVVLLLRDLWLSLFMVASTVLGYLAALGLTYWVFTGCFGAEGIDWKVEVFLFVVMVAVGQDYNIFLASRLAQEGRRAPPARAARRAIVATGGIISSCGVIMAVALGSLMAGDLALLVQLGFAFAVGMIIDTFAVRPLLLPAFAVLTRRTGRNILGTLDEPPESAA